MRSSLLAEPPVQPASIARRQLLGAAMAFTVLEGWAAQDDEVHALLRTGGVVAAFRHAQAPGTFDPPGFRLGTCSTQRNLSEAGREQARQIGLWFRQRNLQPSRVLSSPWCRCVDSATLAFGAPVVWNALGSPAGAPETTGASHLRALQRSLAQVSATRGTFEVWFTHMFVLADLANANTSSGEALLLRSDSAGAPQVLARLALPA